MPLLVAPRDIPIPAMLANRPDPVPTKGSVGKPWPRRSCSRLRHLCLLWRYERFVRVVVARAR